MCIHICVYIYIYTHTYIHMLLFLFHSIVCSFLSKLVFFREEFAHDSRKLGGEPTSLGSLYMAVSTSSVTTASTETLKGTILGVSLPCFSSPPCPNTYVVHSYYMFVSFVCIHSHLFRSHPMYFVVHSYYMFVYLLVIVHLLSYMFLCTSYYIFVI